MFYQQKLKKKHIKLQFQQDKRELTSLIENPN